MPRPAACPTCRRPCPPPPAAGTSVLCPNCQTSFVVRPPARGAGARPRFRPRDRRRERLLQWAWRALVVGIFLLLLTGTLVYLATSLGLFEPRITRANFERLAVGMKESQLRQVLGAPTRIDNSAVPKPTAVAASSDTIHPGDFPRTFFWEEGENVIWAEVRYGRVLKVGATLEGEQIGEDPQTHGPDKPSRDEAAPGD